MTMEVPVSAMSMEIAVQEVMKQHKSLPARPGMEEVEAARSLIQNVEREDELKLERIAEPKRGKDVPEEMCMILQEMQRNLIHLHSKEQKKEAQKLLDLEGVHSLFDELIQRASECLKSYASSRSPKSKNTSANYLSSNTKKTALPSLPSGSVHEESFKAKDDLFLKKPKPSLHHSSTSVSKCRGHGSIVVLVVVDGPLSYVCI